MHFDPTYWWLTISDELPLGFPLVHTLKHQAPVSPEAEVLPIGKRLCLILGVSLTPLPDTDQTGNLAGTDTEMSGWEPNDSPQNGKEYVSVKYFPFPGKLAQHPCQTLTRLVI